MDVKKVMNAVNRVENVEDIHDFHVWSISVGKVAASAHVRAKKNPMKVLKDITDILKEEKIGHVTIQVEEIGTLGDCT